MRILTTEDDVNEQVSTGTSDHEDGKWWEKKSYNASVSKCLSRGCVSASIWGTGLSVRVIE